MMVSAFMQVIVHFHSWGNIMKHAVDHLVIQHKALKQRLTYIQTYPFAVQSKGEEQELITQIEHFEAAIFILETASVEA